MCSNLPSKDIRQTLRRGLVHEISPRFIATHYQDFTEFALGREVGVRTLVPLQLPSRSDEMPVVPVAGYVWSIPTPPSLGQR